LLPNPFVTPAKGRPRPSRRPSPDDANPFVLVPAQAGTPPSRSQASIFSRALPDARSLVDPAPASTRGGLPSGSQADPEDAQPGPSSAVVRARKRLRGEPVSPSPAKDKRRRLALAPSRNPYSGGAALLASSDSEEEEDAAYVDDSPVKPAAAGFKLLFDEAVTRPSRASSRSRSSSAPDVPRTSSSPSTSVLGGDDDDSEDSAPAERRPKPRHAAQSRVPRRALPGKDDLFSEVVPPRVLAEQMRAEEEEARRAKTKGKRKAGRQETVRAPRPPEPKGSSLGLIPPSPPPPGEEEKKKRCRDRARSGPAKRAKMQPEGDEEGEEEDEEESASEDKDVKVYEWSWSRRHPPEGGAEEAPAQAYGDGFDLDDPGLGVSLGLFSRKFTPRKDPAGDADLLPSPVPYSLGGGGDERNARGEFAVDLPEHLRTVLSIAPARDGAERRLVKGVLSGDARAGHKGGPIWDVGEMDEEEEGVGALESEGQDDEWEGEGVPWEVGEL
jgi:hypothetical protein